MKRLRFTKNPIRWVCKEIIMPLAMAILVIQFVIQAFKIPSQSMEDSLLVGDFLLGLKFVYGSPLPFSDNRTPSMIEPDTGNIIIFRYPGEPQYPDYDNDRYSHLANLLILGNYYWDHQPKGDQPSLISYFQGPKDFIKRVVAKSGQTIEVRDKKFFIDGKQTPIPGYGKILDPVARLFRDNFGPVTLPKPGQTIQFDTLSLAELHRVRSLIVQENPSSIVNLDLNLYVDGILNNEYQWSPINGSPFYAPGSAEAMNIALTKDIYSADQAKTLARSDFSKDPISFQREFKEPLLTGFLPDQQVMNQPASMGMRSVAYYYYFTSWVEGLDYNLQTYKSMRKRELASLTQVSTEVTGLTSVQDSISNKNISSISDSSSTTSVASVKPTKIGQIPDFEVRSKLTIDGQEIKGYTIEQDVYFMAGDNRDNSSDSRFWGYLSRNNVKAKAFIIYMSIDNENNISLFNPFSWLSLPLKIRWTRIGKLIHGV